MLLLQYMPVPQAIIYIINIPYSFITIYGTANRSGRSIRYIILHYTTTGLRTTVAVVYKTDIISESNTMGLRTSLQIQLSSVPKVAVLKQYYFLQILIYVHCTYQPSV